MALELGDHAWHWNHANSVTAALSGRASTRGGDLDDSQTAVVQNEIQKAEGTTPGASLTWDSDEIPVETSDLLPGGGGTVGCPRALVRVGSTFTADVPAPVRAARRRSRSGTRRGSACRIARTSRSPRAPTSPPSRTAGSV